MWAQGGSGCSTSLGWDSLAWRGAVQLPKHLGWAYPQQDMSLPKLPQLPVGDGALDSDQESVRTLGSEPPAPPPRDSRRSTLPPLVGEAER